MVDVSENVARIGFIGYQALHEVALTDVQHAQDAMQRDFDDQFYRRAFVRALFAFIEADVWGRKTISLYLNEKSDSKILSVEEASIAGESMAVLNEDGSVRTTEPRLHFLANLRFSFRAFARTFHIEDFGLSVDDGGWASLRNAVKVRDRLMHPKGAKDFMVSEAEIEVCRDALIWYDKEASRLNRLVAERLELGG